MEKIRCVAIDDEPLALDVIRKFCERLGGLDLSVYSDPVEGMEAVLRDRPPLVFLDIDMGNVSGLDIAARIPEGTCFIFTTAYLDYAVEGFNLDAVDYLHKPFPFSRFESAISKAMRRIRPDSGGKKTIVVKQEYNNVAIPLDDILYVEAMEGYSKIFRCGGECVLTRVILKKLESMLPQGEFVRIHRSYIVARSKITSYKKQEVCLQGGVTLPVGRQYADKF